MIYPIGSVSLFINVNKEQNSHIDSQLLESIAEEILKDFKGQIKRYDFEVDFNIDITWKRGCIIETLSIGIVLAAGYKFLIDYDKIRKNLKLIVEDFKSAYLKISKRRKKDKKDLDQIEIVRNSQENLNKETLKEVFKSKDEIILIHKIAVMRDDLSEKISEQEIMEFFDQNRK